MAKKTVSSEQLTAQERELLGKFISDARMPDEIPATRTEARALIEQYVQAQVKAETVSYPFARRAFVNRFGYLPAWCE